MTEDLLARESKKYDLAHQGEVPFHHKRQINELLSAGYDFHKSWRSCIQSKLSFLEIGIGCGSVLRYLHDQNLNYLGVDISPLMVDSLSAHGLHCQTLSCHNLKALKDNSFDVVQHLDGMEHIPIEWENQALKEAVRVAKKYVFYANAMGGAFLDTLTQSAGLGPVHINTKTASEWGQFYADNVSYGYEILYTHIISPERPPPDGDPLMAHHNTFFTVLKVN